MKKEMFQVYKQTLMGWIKSCINPEQLMVCKDVMDRFHEQFMFCVDARERSEAMDELRSEWLQQQAMMNV